MHEPHVHPPVATEQHPEHHEHHDIHVKPLIWFVVIFFAATIAIHIGLYWVFWIYKSNTEPASNIRQVSGDVASEMKPVVPEPRVQGIDALSPAPDGTMKPYHKNTPREDTFEMKRQTENWLESSGESAEKGYYHIPIEAAMRLAVERKLIKPRTGPASTQPKGGAGVAR